MAASAIRLAESPNTKHIQVIMHLLIGADHDLAGDSKKRIPRSIHL
jgi:hypothetical protein